MADLPTIFCFIDPDASLAWSPDVVVVAMTGEGELLGHHISSSTDWARRDIGIEEGGASGGKAERYAARYPDGYELLWLADDNPRLEELLELARNRTAAS